MTKITSAITSSDDRAFLQPRFVDTREASRITGIPVSTLVTWRSRGGGPPFYKIPTNGRVRYEVSSLLTWIRSSGEMISTANYSQVITRDSLISEECKLTQSKRGSDPG